MNYLVLSLLFCIQYICKTYGSYYWRDYHNKIPLDAFRAGSDVNQENVFIGQGFIRPEPNQGIYPTSIHRRQDVYVPQYGAKKVDNFVQILCSTDPENFEWLPGNSTHLHLIQTTNELVRGGVENDQWLNIGRLNYQGSTVVGKVLSAHIGNADIWFLHNGKEIKAESYEVLTYNDIASKIQVRVNS